jgi:hypothetical protein
MTYKVIQWATGDMGSSCLRAILLHPDLQLVGLRVYNPEKIGQDAGVIAGLEPIGVLATDDIEEILKTEADVVVHAARLQPPHTHHNADLCRLLASGKNVISINGNTFPAYWGKEYEQQFQEACRAGNSSFLGTGLNPGFISERLAAVVSGMCARIDSITITEVLECDKLPDPTYAFDILGFGSELGSIDPNSDDFAPAEMVNGLFKEVVSELVDRLGFELDRVETDHRMLPATRDLQVAAGTIRKGTNSHTRWCWNAIVDGKPFFTMVINWVMEAGHLPAADCDLWNLRIKGEPNIDLGMNMSMPSDYAGKASPHGVEPAVGLGVAGMVVNNIRYVCQQPAGILRVPIVGHYRKRAPKPG